MIPKVGNRSSTFTTTFKANVNIPSGKHDIFYFKDDACKEIKKQFKEIGDDNDYFDHDLDFKQGTANHCFEYYRSGNKKKRVRFELKVDSYLSVSEATKILIKSIKAKEPITCQELEQINSTVEFPHMLGKPISYFLPTDVNSKDNFYYRNNNKAVCIQNITSNTGVAEYYDKNGNLKFKKYKNGNTVITEKYDEKGKISYKIVVSDDYSDCPEFVIKDNKIFPLYEYCSEQDQNHAYRILFERNNRDEILKYVLDDHYGIRPFDASPYDNYSIKCENEFHAKDNQKYAEKLLRKNPLYTPEHLKELYLLPYSFIKEYIEDCTIFRTNYGINLDTGELKPDMKKYEYNNYASNGKDSYHFKTISTIFHRNCNYNKNFVLSPNMTCLPNFILDNYIVNVLKFLGH